MKKGFTLIEIIVSITLMVIIGVGSFVGVRYITNKVRINKLNQITDKVIQAAEVYLESNNEVRTHLYNNGEGVVIPIKLLVNEGLLTLENTDIKESDYEKEYVVTALGSTTQSEKCVTITTNASWNLNATTPLYICTDNNGNQNLKIISPEYTDINNKSIASREPYYFRGNDPSNYAKLFGNDVQILSIDVDDSLYLYSYNGNNLDNIDDKYTAPTAYSSRYREYNYGNSTTYSSTPYICLDYKALPLNHDTYRRNESKNGKVLITSIDYINTISCKNENVVGNYEDSSWIEHPNYNEGSNGNVEVCTVTNGYVRCAMNCNSNGCIQNGIRKFQWKIHLKSCMKITSGTGDIANPYIIEPKNC